MSYIPNMAQALRLLPAALLFLVCSLARADTFQMKSGNEIKGVVVSENASSVLVDLGYGTMNLEKADIVKIRRATKTQRETSRKELLQGKFSSGALVPKGAEKLAGLFRAVRVSREETIEDKSLRAARAAELKGIEEELSGLKKSYSESSEELSELDPQSDSSEYDRVVREINTLADQIRAKELGSEELRRQTDKPSPSFQAYLDAYNKIRDYLQGEGKPLIETPRKGQDEEYFTWLRGELSGMKRDFAIDSIESETRDGHLIVKVILNGRVSARLMVDTGATTTVLYGNTAAALKLGPEDMLGTVNVIWGDARTYKAQAVRLRSLAVGKSVVSDSAATIVPRAGDGIDGLLGMSFLSRFVFRIDGTNGKLILESMK